MLILSALHAANFSRPASASAIALRLVKSSHASNSLVFAEIYAIFHSGERRIRSGADIDLLCGTAQTAHDTPIEVRVSLESDSNARSPSERYQSTSA